ncbi:hypothetical protein A3A71_02455 [Candidatus Berkelbacteria bacterium RIFCSPLOWO2_01_FULL_50_28]|uniref:phenylalanine--tRNA ligase n=1 Tax=Candidatus Berkelbacteria bacterium RIFCSPLOWO2_01_FULL_50_28 TaxID=1797471 RepID=A0A1F5EBU2_9BACT|nr:MAG: hypothetical protein A2807_00850 [Candidatus Berkelbacteria bacterium RIFCSPHIGHO2_01_FULL_50_36]OGD62240.1 MAG: hypothetical protein A3F39_00870 [Candidatus Berkelbacteria bacterium RIFCSPHIGHO2_12_FULL_50_11]OGD64882.1 MAG: hypothetical protein A3A71_02455 [Candidatus Berkelbacteria bacterium RIFCSPLOWO2_01_FULL_50_28]
MISGHPHPITVVLERLIEYFTVYGFEVFEGPEVETEANNFDRLNIPADHPVREEHDTFFLTSGLLLRTHTSPMQLRIMDHRQAPIRALVPGRVFRNESTDSTHNHTFNQLEGFVLDENANMEQLITTLKGMLNHLMGGRMRFRVRPSYFPFVEPGIELDLFHRGKFVEVLGAGMIHPNVLAAMNVDQSKYTGWAFGVGIERLLNLVSDVEDARLNLSGDYRYSGQFKC